MPAIARLAAVEWNRLNRLLESALAFDEGPAREGWLRELPASDADLAPLLRQLLSDCAGVETGAFAAALPEPDPHAADERPGQTIGPYRLLREIGQGGMGTVWLAERADGAFERRVALKLPRAQWIDRGLAQRFARERAMLASLNHPHIAQLFDAGWSEGGRPYLALEHVEGQPITEWCGQRQLDTTARAELFVSVIRAVAHAHARLIVHRDLKPSNVLVTAEGQVKLLDFGIAKLLADDSASAEETELTRQGGRVLTPQYAAPEQILGKPVSTASDTYSLGVLLFQLLTGERPYRLPSDAAPRRSALEEAILRVDAPPPSTMAKDPALRRALRGDLDAIVLKALAKAPEQRYETAAAFADDIERHLAKLPVQAQRATRLYRLRRLVVRNRLAVTAVAAVVVALSAGLSLALWQASVARGEAQRATLIKDFVLSIIQQADPVASRQTREADFALLSTAEGRVDHELASHPELALQMRRAIGAAYRNRGDFQRAGAALRKGIEQARATLPPDHLELLGAWVQIADLRVIDSRRAWTDLGQAIALLRQKRPEARALLADALLARHLSTGWRDKWTEVVATGREAYDAARATGDEGRILFAGSEVGQMFVWLGHDPPGTLTLITEALELATRSGRIAPSDPRHIGATARRARALCAAGRKDEALPLAEQALNDARRHHGPDSNATELASAELAEVFRCRGELERALPPMREAYAISIRRESPESENRLLRAGFLMGLLLGLGRHDEIEPLMKANPYRKPIAGSPADSAGATPVHYQIDEAGMRLQMGDPETAERLAEECAAMMEQEQAWITAGHVYHVLAHALHENGKLERAEAFAVKALAYDGEWTPPTPGGRATKLLLLARIRLDRGHHQHAIDATDEVLPLYKGKPTPGVVADVALHRGRGLLGLGRVDEAVRALANAHTHRHAAAPEGFGTARAASWYGRALIAAGDAARGRALVDAARAKLATSRVRTDRALAERPPSDG